MNLNINQNEINQLQFNKKLSYSYFIKQNFVKYLFVLTCIFISIPVTMLVIVFSAYAFKVLMTNITPITWGDLVGQSIAPIFENMFSNTEIASGFSLEIQKKWFVPILIVSAITVAMANGLRELILENIGEKIAKSIRTSIVINFLGANYKQARKVNEGLLAGMVGEDAKEIKHTFIRLLGTFVSDFLHVLVFIYWLYLVDAKLFLLFIAVALPAIIVIRVAGKTLKKLSKQGLQSQSELFSGLLEKLGGWQTIRTFNAIDFELHRFNQLNSRLFNIWRRATRAKSLSTPLVEWLGTIAAVCIIVVALKKLSENSITSSAVTMFIFTISIIADKSQAISNQINLTKRGSAAIKRINEFFAKLNGNTKGNILNFEKIKSESINTIELINLSVNNTETEELLCENININLKKGDICAIIGPSGAGKSTLIRYLLGLENIKQGKILVNNIELTEEYYCKIAPNISFIPQDPFLFEGTVFANIIYPYLITTPNDADVSKVKAILEKVNLDKDVFAEINCLSGGEKQRLMFARALYQNTDLWFIDEATSALDLENEKNLLNLLKTEANDKIIIAVAHRPMLREYASQLIDFEKLLR